MPKRALITGITGQDGSYLTELLVSKGYEVHGLVRRTSSMQRARLDHLNLSEEEKKARVHLHYGDLAETAALNRLFHTVQPDEVYHLGGQSHVRVSFDAPETTFDVNASGCLRLLECIREVEKPTRFYHASTCEVFGRPSESPQNENTRFHPVSPYACSKAASHFLTTCYRESYAIFACNGILYNHESPRRGENFVTRKIARSVAAIKKGVQDKIQLGNLEVKKDWGYAPEYVEAMWLMLQQDQPDDYIIATGEAHSVGEFVQRAFKRAGLDWRKYVETDPHQIRPSEVGLLVGNADKAQKKLGWKPATRFNELVDLMVDFEIQALEENHDPAR
jgi:GDPmannose 4,6-dehydratase